jgi:predicted  nucleic acid-binding Zn-ribbon protein
MLQDAMSHKDAYVAGLETQIQEWSARIDGLSAKAEKLSAEARRAYQKQIEDGRVKLGVVRQEVAALRAVGSDKWEEAKATVESFWKDAKAMFENDEFTPGK